VTLQYKTRVRDSPAAWLVLIGCGPQLKKCQFGRYFVITLNEETLSSGLASDSLLFPNPASPNPVRDDKVVISSCNRRHQLTEAVKGELYIDSLETSTKLTYYRGKTELLAKHEL